MPANSRWDLIRRLRVKLILAANVTTSDFSSEQAEPQRASRSAMVVPRGVNFPAKIKVKAKKSICKAFGHDFISVAQMPPKSTTFYAA